jgi:K+-transporting ATPase ATPase B chain
MATTLTPPPVVEDSTTLIPKRLVRARPLFDPEILRRALQDSFVKLNPLTLMKNPVIFVVEVGAALTTAFLIRDAFIGAPNLLFELQIVLWLWFTVFATFAEAMAEARGMAQRIRCARRRPTRSRVACWKTGPSRKFPLQSCGRET